jgi:hypothetical protein
MPFKLLATQQKYLKTTEMPIGSVGVVQTSPCNDRLRNVLVRLTGNIVADVSSGDAFAPREDIEVALLPPGTRVDLYVE